MRHAICPMVIVSQLLIEVKGVKLGDVVGGEEEEPDDPRRRGSFRMCGDNRWVRRVITCYLYMNLNDY